MGKTEQLIEAVNHMMDKNRSAVAALKHRIDDVTGMLELLFEYARLEADEIPLQYEKLNMGNIFADTLSLFYEDFVRTGFEPSIHMTDAPAYIYADVHGVKMILENLIKNALVHGTYI